MMKYLGNTKEPWRFLSTATEGTIAFDFEVTGFLENSESVTCIAENKDTLRVLLLPTDQVQLKPDSSLDDIAFLHELRPVDFASPWRLETVEVPKPWGAEIWYTGIESRGVCTVSGIPLHWLIALDPERTIGKTLPNAPLLLKILAPFAEGQFGDLYFELHEQKVEVYIVTHVDETAWPDGVGAIRYGFNQTLLEELGEDRFREQYLAAATAYEATRREVDGELDKLRAAEGLDPDAPVRPEVQQGWLSQLDKSLLARETAQRETMYQYTAMRQIRVGDVIQVEPFFPHSLQHGVRVVEFQTAHYERYILSFAQKVLTQNHWDTDEAVKKAKLGMPEPETFEVVSESDGHLLECVADFDAFRALRLKLEPGASLALDINDYALVIGISGQVSAGSETIHPETAFLLPSALKQMTLSSVEGGIVLIATPTA